MIIIKAPDSFCMVKELLISVILAFARLIVSIVLSVGAIHVGMRLLDRLTAGIDEWQEIRKGNAAVGILYATVVICLIILMLPRIEEIVTLIQGQLPWQVTLYYLALTAINYLIDLLLSVFLLYLAVNLLDRLTTDIDEMGALKKGNVAVALIMSAILLAVTLAARVPMESTFLIVKAIEGLLIGAAG